MEEVPAHVHPEPIVLDALSRQHEHRSGLIWSGDHEMCYTDLQCRRFGQNLFQCYSMAPRRLLCMAALGGARQIRRALVLVQIWACSRIPTLRPQLITEIQANPLAPLGACDTRLDLHRIQLRGNDHIYWGTQHAIHLDAWYQWRLRYIRWYRGITQVYIGNLVNRDTRSHGYQPVGVDGRMMTSMLQEVNDVASVVIREPPSSPSQIALFAKKVQMIIWKCMPSGRRAQEHVPDRGAHGVNRGARRHPERGAGGGRPPIPPERHEHVDPNHVDVEKGKGSGSGQPHASSSDEEERADDMDGLQRYEFGHRVGKKTTRFTPSDWL
ncbi:hypothetical protein M9H77_13183 [Catharanthus roseus]|uniref:Uncharacterized protein n=1 Tax=Catharanthus roseus TaxID=4058 RepID=A0ACC0BJQ3_CATRO|nr:hypothetical protein M9H77_13183 [Catharanthus roseus]